MAKYSNVISTSDVRALQENFGFTGDELDGKLGYNVRADGSIEKGPTWERIEAALSEARGSTVKLDSVRALRSQLAAIKTELQNVPQGDVAPAGTVVSGKGVKNPLPIAPEPETTTEPAPSTGPSGHLTATVGTVGGGWAGKGDGSFTIGSPTDNYANIEGEYSVLNGGIVTLEPTDGNATPFTSRNFTSSKDGYDATLTGAALLTNTLQVRAGANIRKDEVLGDPERYTETQGSVGLRQHFNNGATILGGGAILNNQAGGVGGYVEAGHNVLGDRSGLGVYGSAALFPEGHAFKIQAATAGLVGDSDNLTWGLSGAASQDKVQHRSRENTRFETKVSLTNIDSGDYIDIGFKFGESTNDRINNGAAQVFDAHVGTRLGKNFTGGVFYNNISGDKIQKTHQFGPEIVWVSNNGKWTAAAQIGYDTATRGEVGQASVGYRFGDYPGGAEKFITNWALKTGDSNKYHDLSPEQVYATVAQSGYSPLETQELIAKTQNKVLKSQTRGPNDNLAIDNPESEYYAGRTDLIDRPSGAKRLISHIPFLGKAYKKDVQTFDATHGHQSKEEIEGINARYKQDAQAQYAVKSTEGEARLEALGNITAADYTIAQRRQASQIQQPANAEVGGFKVNLRDTAVANLNAVANSDVDLAKGENLSADQIAAVQQVLAAKGFNLGSSANDRHPGIGDDGKIGPRYKTSLAAYAVATGLSSEATSEEISKELKIDMQLIAGSGNFVVKTDTIEAVQNLGTDLSSREKVQLMLEKMNGQGQSHIDKENKQVTNNNFGTFTTITDDPKKLFNPDGGPTHNSPDGPAPKKAAVDPNQLPAPQGGAARTQGQ